MAEDSPYLFVYGTLRRGYANEFAQALHAEAEWIGLGEIPGQLYLLGNRVFIYPGADYDPASEHRITGEILLLNDNASLLEKLDEYEGMGPKFPEPQEYRRLVVPVKMLDDGRTIDCWCYVFNHPPQDRPLIAGGDFSTAYPPASWTPG